MLKYTDPTRNEYDNDTNFMLKKKYSHTAGHGFVAYFEIVGIMADNTPLNLS